jgi:hypothetical protein
MKEATKHYLVKDGILYRAGWIKVRQDKDLKMKMLKSRNKSRLAGHPGKSKTLSLACRSFTWPSMKSFVNCYIDGCNSCLRVKSSTQKPFGTLKPLPIPAGPWTDISYDLTTVSALEPAKLAKRLFKSPFFILVPTVTFSS